ncbi:MAG: HNH endonuclease [Treponema sp.]|nr:HNH endonuclease [Treponema sp.]
MINIILLDEEGSNSEENIQILCQKCNLLKSDKIGSSI